MKFLSKIIPLLLLAGLSCQQNSQTEKNESAQPVSESRFLMDTIITISVHDSSRTDLQIHSAIDTAFSVIKSMENVASAHLKSSELSLLNATGGEKRHVSEELYYLLQRSIEISDQTRGNFDPTIGSVKKIWDFTTTAAVPPDSADIVNALKRVSCEHIVLHQDQSVTLKGNASVDLGGIAKGYAIDLAVSSLKENGISAGIVEAGGDLRIFGSHPDRETWGIGIKHPRNPGKLFGVLRISESSIATSGDYERFFMYKGHRYHHLLDPETGFPAEHCISVTIQYPDALTADAYATAVFILGPEEGMALIESIPRLEGLIIYREAGELKHTISTGLRELIEIG